MYIYSYKLVGVNLAVLYVMLSLSFFFPQIHGHLSTLEYMTVTSYARLARATSLRRESGPMGCPGEFISIIIQRLINNSCVIVRRKTLPNLLGPVLIIFDYNSKIIL